MVVFLKTKIHLLDRNSWFSKSKDAGKKLINDQTLCTNLLLLARLKYKSALIHLEIGLEYTITHSSCNKKLINFVMKKICGNMSNTLPLAADASRNRRSITYDNVLRYDSTLRNNNHIITKREIHFFSWDNR